MSTAGALLTYLALCATPTLVFGAISAALGPSDSRVKRAGGWVVSRPWAVRHRPVSEPVVDPFAVLEVQFRLDRLAAEIADLERHPHGSARGHHLRVALAAYDDVLGQACRMADVPVDTQPGAAGRRRREAALRSRGWCW